MGHDSKLDIDKAAGLLSLLANPRRLEILGRITKREWSVCALAEEVNLSQSALSQHLGKFRKANVVQVRRDAQNIYYSCSADSILKVLATLDEISHKNSADAKTVA